MCGVAGAVVTKGVFGLLQLNSMLNSIEHRGPDSSGLWNEGNVYLGHRRLSIHDLSNAGHQPMETQDKRYTIVFNGEIYNFLELKAELGSGIRWRGHSDTEVMLEAFNRWGVFESLKKFNGMFAFSVWDKFEKKLTLARDKFGEKPLYYSSQNGVFVFASELTAIETLSHIDLTIDRSAVSQQIQTSYIPAPLTIYNEVKKLEPGSFIQVSTDLGIRRGVYWSLSTEIEHAKKDPFEDECDAVEQLEVALKKAVKLRMASDVPLGGFLSGGVDSSLVVALMQDQSMAPVNTFSIGFDVPGYNEAVYAKEVASYLGTNHHEQYLSPHDALSIVPSLGGIFDEPFSDASQIPTFLVSKMAKEKVTVCLSGDGGDELFSGYKRYQAGPAIWNKMSKLPCKKTFAKIINRTPVAVLDKLFFFLKPYATKYGREGQIGTKIKTLGHWLKAQNLDELYRLSMLHWKNSDKVVIGSTAKSFWGPACDSLDDAIEKMMYQDSIAYLPGDILTKVDRAAMAVSLEGRIPLLDPDVAKVAWKMPIAMKQKGDCGKWPLKQVLYKYLPQKMMERPKMGFGVPIHLWLKDELKDWATDLLSYKRLNDQNLFDAKLVNQSLENHLSGEENNAAELWDVLMMQSWLDSNADRARRL